MKLSKLNPLKNTSIYSIIPFSLLDKFIINFRFGTPTGFGFTDLLAELSEIV